MKNIECKYQVTWHNRFKKHLRLAEKRGLNSELLYDLIRILGNGKKLPPKYQDHALKKDYTGHRECHITGDWLLIYKIFEDKLILELVDTGTHSDLF